MSRQINMEIKKCKQCTCINVYITGRTCTAGVSCTSTTASKTPRAVRTDSPVRTHWATATFIGIWKVHMSHNVGKRNFGHARPAMIEIRLRIRAKCADHNLHWCKVFFFLLFFHAANEDSDQTARMRSLISLRSAHMSDYMETAIYYFHGANWNQSNLCSSYHRIRVGRNINKDTNEPVECQNNEAQPLLCTNISAMRKK